MEWSEHRHRHTKFYLTLSYPNLHFPTNFHHNWTTAGAGNFWPSPHSSPASTSHSQILPSPLAFPLIYRLSAPKLPPRREFHLNLISETLYKDRIIFRVTSLQPSSQSPSSALCRENTAKMTFSYFLLCHEDFCIPRTMNPQNINQHNP